METLQGPACAKSALLLSRRIVEDSWIACSWLQHIHEGICHRNGVVFTHANDDAPWFLELWRIFHEPRGHSFQASRCTRLLQQKHAKSCELTVLPAPRAPETIKSNDRLPPRLSSADHTAPQPDGGSTCSSQGRPRPVQTSVAPCAFCLAERQEGSGRACVGLGLLAYIVDECSTQF